MSSSSNSRTAQNLSRETRVKAVVDALSEWRDEVNTMQAAETWQRNWASALSMWTSGSSKFH
jgi:hypothetical protein